MVEIKLLATKQATPADQRRGLKRITRLKRNHEQHPDFVRRRYGSLKRGAEIDLLNMTLEDFNVILTSLKTSSNTALRLYNRPLGSDGKFEPIRFRPSDPTTCAAMERFSRALARAMGPGGWVQELELGFLLSRQDIKVVSRALSCSSSLQHLSLANSGLGDDRLQLLARGLCECLPLQVLDLSGCALTDSSVTSVTSIIKVGVQRTADTEWRLSLRESGGGKLKSRIPRLTGHQGLISLDLSFNMFSDATSRQLCDVLRLGATLEALNLQGNQLRKKSAQMYLLVYQIWGLPRLVDLRKNLDGKDVGVLEDGKHLRSFSSRDRPFWNVSLLASPAQNLPEQGRNSDSQRKGPEPRDNCPRGPSLVRDPATYGGISRNKISIQSLSSTAEMGTRDNLDQGKLADWSSPASPLDLRDPTPQERNWIRREECIAVRQGNDHVAVQDSVGPLNSSLCLTDRVDQIIRLSCTKAGDQFAAIPTLDSRKEHPDVLETKSRQSQSDDIQGDNSPRHPEEQSSDKLGGRLGECQSRPLSPIRDPATPELTSRTHPKRAASMEEQNRADLRNRTSEEFILSGRQRARKSVDGAHCDRTPRINVWQGPNFGRCQPAEWKMRGRTQTHPEQSMSNDPKRRDKNPCKKIRDPGQELRHRQSRDIKVNCQNLKRKQSAKPSQQDPLLPTSEWQREESEWGAFMCEMARSLVHLQEALDVLMGQNPDAEHNDDGAVTELHQMLATFSS